MFVVIISPLDQWYMTRCSESDAVDHNYIRYTAPIFGRLERPEQPSS